MEVRDGFSFNWKIDVQRIVAYRRMNRAGALNLGQVRV